MRRAKLIERLDQEWAALLEAFAGLPDDALLEPGVAGAWSVRDLLCHVTTWEEECLKAVPLIVAGKRLPRYGGIDAFNAREHEGKRGLSLDQVRRDLVATHERLLSLLSRLPDLPPRTRERLRRRLRWDTYGHYREHAAQIANWRGTRGK